MLIKPLLVLLSWVFTVAQIQTDSIHAPSMRDMQIDIIPVKSQTNAPLSRHGRGTKDSDKEATSISVNQESTDKNYTTALLAGISLLQCPYADFCHVNSTEKDYLYHDYEDSCCESCYCHQTCGKDLNCCFEDFDLYKEVSTYNMECVRPKISFLNVSRVTVRDYYMITECRGDLTNKCINKTVAAWGSLLPVYSKTKDKLYYNRYCAECNQAGDYQEFKLSLSCKVISDTQLTMTDNLLVDALQGISCEIVFIPPEDVPIKKFECVKNSINRCNVTGSWAEFDPLIDNACKTVYAPVRQSYDEDFLFANIFCVLCNQIDYNPIKPCPKYDYDVKDPSISSFSVLLDYDVFNKAEQKQMARITLPPCRQFEVIHPFKEECRTVACPAGHLRTSDGCRVYAPTWYVPAYNLYLDLEASDQGNISDTPEDLASVQELKMIPAYEIMSAFERIGLEVDSWLMFALTTNKQTGYIRELSIKLYRNTYPIDANKTLSSIRMALGKKFIINRSASGTKPFSYDIKLSKTIGSHFDNFNIDVNYTLVSSFGNPDYGFILNNMYFCEQVRLWQGEWRDLDTFGQIEVALEGSAQRLVLHALEYSDHVTETGESYVQICVDDFNPNPDRNIRNSGAKSGGNIMIITLLLYFSRDIYSKSFGFSVEDSN